MEEREKIRIKKEAWEPQPWSDDPIFQTAYFCNVQREDDKVTKWIREKYSPFVSQPMFEVNIALTRFLNWPPTLRAIGYQPTDDWAGVLKMLNELPGKVFGNAYIVSTNGRAMPKAQYVCEVLMPAITEALGPRSGWRATYGQGTLAAAYNGLKGVYGLGSFMAGQVLADLKNTQNHPLWDADDWWDFVVPGPGSIRGVSWILYGSIDLKEHDFKKCITYIRRLLGELHCDLAQQICNQDLQNCLCEFDKYCRVQTGTGRSKRTYDGGIR
jgi:alpha-glutamyl/putrescinyl thymine pyrophosphorylase clade 1